MNVEVAFYEVFAFLFALAIGSFLNVAIGRIPEDRSVSHPPSHCPRCGSFIQWYDNIPILSWLLLGAKCRACKAPISSLYPTIELMTGLLGWLIYRRIVDGPEDLHAGTLVGFWVYLIFAACLVVLTFVDLRHSIIPDQTSIWPVLPAIGGMALAHWLGFEHGLTWQQSARGALIAGGVPFAMASVWRLARGREALGMGDVKLLALIGAVLGDWPALPYILVLSSLLGSVFGLAWMLGRRVGLKAAFPFGPFLAFAAMVYLLHGPAGMHAWFSQIGWLFGQRA